jgi:hypothetical protein
LKHGKKIMMVLLSAAALWTTLGLTQDKLEPARSLYEHPGGILFLNDFYVPADHEIIFTDSVEIRVEGEIVIDGIIRGANSTGPGHERKKITLSSLSGIVIRGDVRCHPGYTGQEVLEDGGPGGELELRAPMIVTNKLLRAGEGGDGGPGGGSGGSGGTMFVSGQYIGPYRAVPENGRSFVRGGEGGKGTKGDRRIGGAANGGAGGAGGGATTTSFEEALWMLPFRQHYWISDEKIAELRELQQEQTDGAPKEVLRRFEPRPVRSASVR